MLQDNSTDTLLKLKQMLEMRKNAVESGASLAQGGQASMMTTFQQQPAMAATPLQLAQMQGG